jgi:type III secretion system YscD/HrpQ family protein
MADGKPADTILKILSGVQSGVDVALVDGDYTLGSSDDDDIQFFDVSVKPRHARLAVRPGGIEIAGATGQLYTKNGLVLEAGGDLQAVEPLDIVSAGTTRFALGSRTANWASITQAESEPGEPAPRPRRTELAGWRLRSWQTAAAAVVILLLAAAGISFLQGDKLHATAEDVAKSELEKVRAALAAFDFRDRLTVRQDIDGALYVTGYVETAVQRRAIMAAVRETEVPARVRISVLKVIRNEVANLLEAEDADLSFDLSDQGDLTLRGVMLDAARASDIEGLVRAQVIGLNSVTSEIRTGPSLLAEVRSLAGRSQIVPLIQLRLDDDLIEASGIMPKQKIDSWVGFLQAYSSQFASIIPLRSFVQLQGSDGVGAAPGKAVFLGNANPRDGDIPVDVRRLRDGSFELGDVLLGGGRNGSPAAEAALSNPAVLGGFGRDGVAGKDGASGRNAAGGRNGAAGRDGAAGRIGAAGRNGTAGSPEPRLPLRAILGMDRADDHGPGESEQNSSDEDGAHNGMGQRVVGGSWTPAPMLDDSEPGSPDPSAMARRLIRLWQKGGPGKDEDSALLNKSVDALDRYQATDSAMPAIPIVERYAPLLARASEQPDGRRCWQDSRLTRKSVLGTLFWLDLLSVNADLTLADFASGLQAQILEAALNPDWVRKCADATAGKPVLSVYLYEVSRNANFVRFITRDFSPFPIDVASASIAGDRYIRTRAGRTMKEGAAPDESSRLLMVGELGAAFDSAAGYSTSIFGADINWLAR